MIGFGPVLMLLAHGVFAGMWLGAAEVMFHPDPKTNLVLALMVFVYMASSTQIFLWRIRVRRQKCRSRLV